MMNTVSILLVEDNPGDADMLREYLQSGCIPCRLVHVSSGDEAMILLRHEGKYQSAERPDLILLDLNIPPQDGREILREIKADPSLRKIPVIVMSSSQSPRDIEESYELQASAYISKPIDLEGYEKITKAIELFWLGIAHYPPKEGVV